jgi:hypothetical protein
MWESSELQCGATGSHWTKQTQTSRRKASFIARQELPPPASPCKPSRGSKNSWKRPLSTLPRIQHAHQTLHLRAYLLLGFWSSATAMQTLISRPVKPTRTRLYAPTSGKCSPRKKRLVWTISPGTRKTLSPSMLPMNLKREAYSVKHIQPEEGDVGSSAMDDAQPTEGYTFQISRCGIVVYKSLVRLPSFENNSPSREIVDTERKADTRPVWSLCHEGHSLPDQDLDRV